PPLPIPTPSSGSSLLQSQVSAELERQLRSASSVTELVDIFYPEYRRIHACLERKSWAAQYKTSQGSGAEAAVFMMWNKEDLKNIELEWEKTQCKPREVCLDVGKELGPTTNTFYKPPCVSVHRCGGCCNNEGLQCVNVSIAFVSKTLMEIKLPKAQIPRPVTVSFLNHTACRCQPKPDSPLHSIIRRSLRAPQCVLANKTCSHGLTWDSSYCDCLTDSEIFSSAPSGQDTEDDICGPRMQFNEDTCDCVCANGLSTSSCGPNQKLDESTCRCVCDHKPPRGTCGEHEEWDQTTCQCVCTRICPKSQPLDPHKCTCQCTESLSSCFLKGKRFDPQTCRQSDSNRDKLIRGQQQITFTHHLSHQEDVPKRWAVRDLHPSWWMGSGGFGGRGG
uniref:Vascular endothelial growth factor C-like n=1 Tax=Callorhinchus milii TaxID=7868 RepID=A0A4W3GGL2_CALMI